MKFFAVVILAVILLLGLNLLRPKVETTEVPLLRISPYLFEESVKDPNNVKDAVFAFEPLELGVPRLLAPIIGVNVYNHCYLLEFEGGAAEIISEDEDVQLCWASADAPWRDRISLDKRTFTYEAHVANRGYVSGNPLSSGVGELVVQDKEAELKLFTGYTGREHYLTVNAYEASDPDSPVIVARLKLVQLEDVRLKIKGRSRFYSIELISYEMSEVYQMELAS